MYSTVGSTSTTKDVVELFRGAIFRFHPRTPRREAKFEKKSSGTKCRIRVHYVRTSAGCQAKSFLQGKRKSTSK